MCALHRDYSRVQRDESQAHEGSAAVQSSLCSRHWTFACVSVAEAPRASKDVRRAGQTCLECEETYPSRRRSGAAANAAA